MTKIGPKYYQLFASYELEVLVRTLGWGEATKPVILRSQVNRSEGKKRQIWPKYYRPFPRESLLIAV